VGGEFARKEDPFQQGHQFFFSITVAEGVGKEKNMAFIAFPLCKFERRQRRSV
jgi:hypothetical protein